MKSQEVINYLFELYRENRFSHAYLIETNNINMCLNDIKTLIKMISCNDDYSSNCDKCSICKLIDNNSLPSLVIVEPSGKTINKESVDSLKQQFAYNQF